MKKYLFQSQRLGFRTWRDEDITPMHQLNTNPEVMRFFPAIKSKEETDSFIQRMRKDQESRGYCFYVVERLEDSQFLGFIGLNHIDYAASFTPCVEIGWRLDKPFWGHGYASEGASRCLTYGFNSLGLERIVAVAPKVNLPSIQVMKRTQMTYMDTFCHPALQDFPALQECVVYKKRNPRS